MLDNATEVADDYAAILDVLYDPDAVTDIFRDRMMATLTASRAPQEEWPDAQLLIESQVTLALSKLSGPGEDNLVRRLCGLAGVEATPTMALYTLSEFCNGYPAAYSERLRDRRAYTRVTEPDFVIASVTPARDNNPATITPVIFVEVKSPGAPTSHGYGYCNDDGASMVWGSQPTCLPHGCWLTKAPGPAQAAFERAAWVWIGPAKNFEHPDGPWGHVRRPTDPVDVEPFEAELAEAKSLWKKATLDDLAEWIFKTPIDGDSVHLDFWARREQARSVRHLSAVRAKQGYKALGRAIKTWSAQ